MKRLILLGAFLALPAIAQDFSRSAAPENGFSYVLGDVQEHWQGGQISWYYNPTNQPAGLSTEDVVGLIKIATAKWEGMCNLQFNYQGLITSAAPMLDATWNTIDRINVIGWAVLTGSRADYDGYTQWWYDASGNMADADMVLNSARTWTQSNKQSLEALITHELGHVLGLQHSKTSESIMYVPYHTYSYQRTLRGDDAQACAALYGASSNAESNRLFNWAEQYPNLFAPAVAASATYAGYYYRYYPTTNSYVGTKDGIVWYIGPDGQLQNLGPMGNYLGTAYGAGF